MPGQVSAHAFREGGDEAMAEEALRRVWHQWFLDRLGRHSDLHSETRAWQSLSSACEVGGSRTHLTGS